MTGVARSGARWFSFGVLVTLGGAFGCATGEVDDDLLGGPPVYTDAGLVTPSVDAQKDASPPSTPTAAPTTAPTTPPPSDVDAAPPPDEDAAAPDEDASAPPPVDAAPPPVDANQPPPPVDAGSTTCGAYVGPTVTASCTACMTANKPCQANGCYGGYWCDTSTDGCKAKPSSCP